jgi:hypothetical protein
MGSSTSKDASYGKDDNFDVVSFSSEEEDIEDRIGYLIAVVDFIDTAVKNHVGVQRSKCKCEFCTDYYETIDDSVSYKVLLAEAIQTNDDIAFKKLWGKDDNQDRFPADCIDVLLDIPQYDADAIANILFRQDLEFSFDYTYCDIFTQFIKCCKIHHAKKCLNVLSKRYPSLYIRTLKRIDDDTLQTIQQCNKLLPGSKIQRSFKLNNHMVTHRYVKIDDVYNFCLCSKCAHKF